MTDSKYTPTPYSFQPLSSTQNCSHEMMRRDMRGSREPQVTRPYPALASEETAAASLDSPALTPKALATSLATLCYYVHPLPQGQKGPKLKDWPTASAIDPDEIAKQFTERNGGVGINCALSQIDVWDFDTWLGKEGKTARTRKEAIEAFVEDVCATIPEATPEEIHEAIANAPCVVTPSTGGHFYFRSPAGAKLKSRDGIAPGVDLKAGYIGDDGKALGAGQVVAPGTRLPPHKVTGRTTYEGNLPCWDELPELPEILIKYVRAKAAAKPGAGARAAGPVIDKHTAETMLAFEGRDSATASKCDYRTAQQKAAQLNQRRQARGPADYNDILRHLAPSPKALVRLLVRFDDTDRKESWLPGLYVCAKSGEFYSRFPSNRITGWSPYGDAPSSAVEIARCWSMDHPTFSDAEFGQQYDSMLRGSYGYTFGGLDHHIDVQRRDPARQSLKHVIKRGQRSIAFMKRLRANPITRPIFQALKAEYDANIAPGKTCLLQIETKIFESHGEIYDEPEEQGVDGADLLVDPAASYDPKADYCIKRMFGPDQIGGVTGPSGSAKTFLALDMASHLTRGKPWHGQKVRRSACLYVGYEGIAGIAKRVRLLEQEYGSHNGWLMTMKTSPPLGKFDGEREGVKKIISATKALISKTGAARIVVFIDTYGRASSGNDENSATDANEFQGRLDDIRKATGATVIVIHHTGKDVAKGDRGSNAFFSNADFRMMVLPRSDQPDIRTAEMTKVKDGEIGHVLDFRLERKRIGKDTDIDGEPVYSCIIFPLAAPAALINRGLISARAQTAFDALADLISSDGVKVDTGVRLGGGKNGTAVMTTAVAAKNWAAVATTVMPGSSGNSKRGAFSKARAELVRTKAVFTIPNAGTEYVGIVPGAEKLRTNSSAKEVADDLIAAAKKPGKRLCRAQK